MAAHEAPEYVPVDGLSDEALSAALGELEEALAQPDTEDSEELSYDPFDGAAPAVPAAPTTPPRRERSTAVQRTAVTSNL